MLIAALSPMPGCDLANLSAIKLNIIDTGWLTVKLILNGNNEHIGDIILILRLFFNETRKQLFPLP